MNALDAIRVNTIGYKISWQVSYREIWPHRYNKTVQGRKKDTVLNIIHRKTRFKNSTHRLHLEREKELLA